MSESKYAGKSRAVSVALAYLFGFVGGHQYYLGNTTRGLIYTVTSWTGIPFLVAIYDGLRYVLNPDWFSNDQAPNAGTAEEAIGEIADMTESFESPDQMNIGTESAEGGDRVEGEGKTVESRVDGQMFETEATMKMFGEAFDENTYTGGSVAFTEEELITPDDERIELSSLCHMRVYESYYYNFKHFDAGMMDKYNFQISLQSIIRFKVQDGGLLYVYKSLNDTKNVPANQLNMDPNRRAKNRVIQNDPPEFDTDMIDFLQDATTDDLLDGAPEEVLVERVGTESKLQIDGWKGTSSKIELSGETSGTTTGLEIGMFSRGKSEAESALEGEITREGWETVIDAATVLEDRILFHMDSSPTIEILLSDIDQVVHTRDNSYENVTEDEVVLETGNNSFRVMCTVGDSVTEYISKRVNAIKQDRSPQKGTGPVDLDIGDSLRELKELRDEEVITEQEFVDKKKDLLSNI